MNKILSIFLGLGLLLSCSKQPLQPTPVTTGSENDVNDIPISQEFDAPFIYEEGNNFYLKRILKKEGSKDDLYVKEFRIENAKEFQFKVFVKHLNSKYNDFEVKVRKNQKYATPAEWTSKNKILVISDYEGRFFGLVDVLREAGVIDEQYNWTFGDNHLVYNGDIFDRGDRQHECMWLLYKLQSEGANIHVLLGNHDLMNLSGSQLNYLDKRYFKTAAALGLKNVPEMYKPNSILGQWLRSKHIMEKGNQILFTHAGVSAEIMNGNNKPSIAEINKVCMQHFDDPKHPDAKKYLSGKNSLIWYRGYFNKPKQKMSVLDEVLMHFNAELVCVGHTTQKHAGLFYDGKVACVNVNVHKGHRQALLFDANQIYNLTLENDKLHRTRIR